MNVAIANMGTPPLSQEEKTYLLQQSGHQPLTWNRFIEMLLMAIAIKYQHKPFTQRLSSPSDLKR